MHQGLQSAAGKDSYEQKWNSCSVGEKCILGNDRRQHLSLQGSEASPLLSKHPHPLSSQDQIILWEGTMDLTPFLLQLWGGGIKRKKPGEMAQSVRYLSPSKHGDLSCIPYFKRPDEIVEQGTAFYRKKYGIDL